jgi:hypothetical protein
MTERRLYRIAHLISGTEHAWYPLIAQVTNGTGVLRQFVSKSRPA